MDMMALLVLLGLGLGAIALFGSSGSGGGGEDDDDLPDEGRSFVGTPGDDLILGTDGPDRIFGGEGNDTLLGGAGDDAIFGGPGNDRIFGGPGNDLLRGGAGDDFLYALSGQDTLFGDTGNDFLLALDGPDQPGQPDQLFGGFGDDILVGDDGDTMEGGAGADIFVVVSWTGDEAPVVIRDFVPGRDALEIALDVDGHPEPEEDDLALVLDDAGERVLVQVFGKTVAILENLTELPEEADVQLFHDDLQFVLQLYRDIEARETAAALAQA